MTSSSTSTVTRSTPQATCTSASTGGARGTRARARGASSSRGPSTSRYTSTRSSSLSPRSAAGFQMWRLPWPTAAPASARPVSSRAQGAPRVHTLEPSPDQVAQEEPWELPCGLAIHCQSALKLSMPDFEPTGSAAWRAASSTMRTCSTTAPRSCRPSAARYPSCAPPRQTHTCSTRLGPWGSCVGVGRRHTAS